MDFSVFLWFKVVCVGLIHCRRCTMDFEPFRNTTEWPLYFYIFLSPLTKFGACICEQCLRKAMYSLSRPNIVSVGLLQGQNSLFRCMEYLIAINFVLEKSTTVVVVCVCVSKYMRVTQPLANKSQTYGPQNKSSSNTRFESLT